jgi:hypothetical protein
MSSRLLPAVFTLCAAAGAASAQHLVSARPGVLNYVEGQASIGATPLTNSSERSALLKPGEVLRTDDGRAEILLTPGVFLRLGYNSAVEMTDASLTNTRLELQRGKAMVDATDLRKENHIVIGEDGASITLLKHGLYDFDADANTVRVFDGKADVIRGGYRITLEKGKQVALAAQPLHAEKFDRKAAGRADPLYAWSKLRSEYNAEASLASARTVIIGGTWGPGWYWNPWWSTWAFLPGNGWLYSPFGYGFYSPWVVYGGPVYAFGPHRIGPYYGGPVYHPVPRVGGFHGGGFGAAGGVGGGVHHGGFQGGGGRR